MEFPHVVDLNVGGRHVTTTLATLTKYPDSMLAAVFSGRDHVTKDKDGRYFIDVDGDAFVHILNFLRFQILPPRDRVAEVKKYAEYFGIDDLVKILNQPTLLTEDDLFGKWASDIPGYADNLKFITDELQKCKIRDGFICIEIKHNQRCVGSPRQHELNYVTIPEDQYVEFVIIRLPSVVDRTMCSTLISVLAHDLRKMGIYLSKNRKPLSSCCFYGRVFKAGLAHPEVCKTLYKQQLSF